MQLTHLTLLLTIALAPTKAINIPQNAVTSLLQGILSPRSTDQAIEMQSTAANKKMAMSNIPVRVNRRFAIADIFPRTAVRSEALPNKVIVQRPQQMALPKNVVVQQLQNRNQMVVPKNMIVQRRIETVLPKNVKIQRSAEAMPRKNEIPKRVVVQNGNDFSLRIPQMRPAVQQKVLRSQPQLTEYVAVPEKIVNSFLPAASLISAFAASSSNVLPPALPQSRGQFLRKIPIPPPSL